MLYQSSAELLIFLVQLWLLSAGSQLLIFLYQLSPDPRHVVLPLEIVVSCFYPFM